jgi:hypothetical protein
MTRNEQERIIREAFEALCQLNLQDGFKDVPWTLYDMNMSSEKGHRKFASGNDGLSKTYAAKLFTVEHLIQGWIEPNKFTVDDILCIRNEVLYAQAYAKRYHAELKEWAEQYRQYFARDEQGKQVVDYVQLMRA